MVWSMRCTTSQSNIIKPCPIEFSFIGTYDKHTTLKAISFYLLTLSARGPTLDVRFWRLKSISALEDTQHRPTVDIQTKQEELTDTFVMA